MYSMARHLTYTVGSEVAKRSAENMVSIGRPVNWCRKRKMHVMNYKIKYEMEVIDCFVMANLGRKSIAGFYSRRLFRQSMYKKQEDDRRFGEETLSGCVKDFQTYYWHILGGVKDSNKVHIICRLSQELVFQCSTSTASTIWMRANLQRHRCKQAVQLPEWNLCKMISLKTYLPWN